MNDFPTLFFYSDWSLLAVRLILAVVLIRHGWSKIKDLRQTATNFSGMGFRPGSFWGTIAAFLEFFGGIAVALGVWVSPIAFLFGGEMLVVILWKLFKWKKPFSECEFELALLGLCFVLLAFGAGYYGLGAGYL
ncbi:MAG: putative oxidoreductase [Parcubacteria group bacterium LiPW_15]|nr:MAG: putative oxidoreductase [Parcubacteria group bacterium LiPW_15]